MKSHTGKMHPSKRFLPVFFSLLPILGAADALAWDVNGTVHVDGIPKDSYAQVPQSEWQACGMVKKMGDLIVAPDGALKNAVVWIDAEFSKAETANKKISKVAFIDQKQCDFEPRAVNIPLSGTVIFRSSDQVRHGVAGFLPTGQNEFDLLLNQKGQTVEAQFNTPGPHYLRCGFHPWMSATVYVHPHPFFAVTDENGAFKISGLPERPYSVKVWHEKMGLTEGFVRPGDSTVRLLYARPENT